MLLAVDIGNTDITIGVYQQNQWTHIWRLASSVNRPELFYGIKLREYFFESRLKAADVNQVVISSVVPGLTDRIISVVRALFEKDPVVLGPEIYAKLPIEVLNPYEIGSDLVANALAAYVQFKKNCIVVDFGTALTFTTISDKGNILGVAIAPGLKTAIKSLSQSAAKLFDVPLELPQSALGKNTVHAIQAGILLGYKCQMAYFTREEEVPVMRMSSQGSSQTSTTNTPPAPEKRTLEITAWYTDQIRPSLGPDRYNTLPGTVLAIDVNNGERVLVARNIEQRELKKNELYVPDSGTKVTQEEYRKTMEEQMEKMRANGGRMFMRN